jgi:murein endopeptidase
MSPRFVLLTLFLVCAAWIGLPGTAAHAYQFAGNSFPFLPNAPESDFLTIADSGLDHGFCSKWDPEYGHLGKACCGKLTRTIRRKLPRCAPQRSKSSFCDEMTADQREFLELVKLGSAPAWWENRGAQSSQAFCSVNSGFLVNGRPLVGTSENRILIRNPNRCTFFGTDGMVAALEWLGREVRKEYSLPHQTGVHINVGDLSAPRGGCIFGRRGGRGHASHTTGQDADIGFLNTRVGDQGVNAFTHVFDAEANWWLIKKIFQNPHVCVKSMFLDRRLIRKLARAALGDPFWPKVASRIQHVRGHRSHLHFRVGNLPGEPGCPREIGWDGEGAPEDEEEMSPGSDPLGAPDSRKDWVRQPKESTQFLWKVSDQSTPARRAAQSSSGLEAAND